jgi:PKD repeat protein
MLVVLLFIAPSVLALAGASEIDGTMDNLRAAGDPQVIQVDRHNCTAEWSGANLTDCQSENLTVTDGELSLSWTNSSLLAGQVQTYNARTKMTHFSVATNSKNEYFLASVGDNSTYGLHENLSIMRYFPNGTMNGIPQMVCATTELLSNPHINVNSKNEFVVSYSIKNTLFVLPLDMNGSAVGQPAPVCITVPSTSIYPMNLIMFSNDSYLLWWNEFSYTDFCQKGQWFDVNNTPLGNPFKFELPANTSISDLMADANTGFTGIITQSTGTTILNLSLQRVDYSGKFNGSFVPFGTLNTSSILTPSIGAFQNGSPIVVWENYSADHRAHVHAQIFNSNLSPVGPDYVTNSTGWYGEEFHHFTVEKNDDVLIGWIEYASPSGGSVHLQRFGPDLAKKGAEVNITKQNLLMDNMAVASDSRNFFMVFGSQHYQDGSEYNCFMYSLLYYSPYLPSGNVLTGNLSVSHLISWGNFSADYTCPNPPVNSIAFGYSIDGGLVWKSVLPGGSLANTSISSGKIRFRATFTSGVMNDTPMLYGIMVNYTVEIAPVIESFPGDRNLPKHVPIQFKVSATDADNDILSYKWSLIEGDSANLNLSNYTSPNLTVTAKHSGNYSIEFTVGDGFILLNRTLNLTVENHQPLISGPASYWSYKKTPFQTLLNASDPDNDSMTFEWTVPDGAKVDISDTGVLNPEITAQNARNVTLQLKVTDEEGNETSIPVELEIAGHCPVANLTANATTVTNGSMVSFGCTQSSDPDGDPLEYNLSYGDGNSTGWVSTNVFIHSYAFPGNYSATLVVRDSDGNVSTPTSIVISVYSTDNPPPPPPPTNFPPSISLRQPANTSTVSNSSVELSWNGADTNNDVLEYSLYLDTTSASTLVTTTNQTGFIIQNLVNGTTYFWKVTVTDGKITVNSSVRQFKVILGSPPVSPTNHLPVFTGSGLPSAVAGKAYTYKFNATDADGDTLNFTLGSGPSGLRVDRSGKLEWLPGKDQTGTFSLSVTVSDGKANVTGQFTITVKKEGMIQPAEESSMLLIGVGIAVVIGAIAGIGAFVMMRRKR